MENTTTEILRNHFDADNSVDEYAIVKAMQEYASQFKQQNEVLRGRVAELDDCLYKCNEVIKILDSANSELLNAANQSIKCPDNRSFVAFNTEIQSLINKGKDNGR